jgi:hypothetical protein
VRPNAALLENLASLTGGKPLANPVQAFRPSGNPGKSIRDLWPFLLLAAALLFPMDVAVRRLALPFAEIWAAVLARLSVLARRRKVRTVAAPQAATIGQLHQAKRRATPAPTGDGAPEMPSAPVAEAPKEPVAARPSAPAPPSSPPGAPLSTAQRLLDAKRQREGKD